MVPSVQGPSGLAVSLGQSSQLLWNRPLPSSLSPSSGNCCLPLTLWAEELSWQPMIANPKALRYSLLFRMVFSCPAHTFINHLFIKILSSFPNFSAASTSAGPLTATYPLRDLWQAATYPTRAHSVRSLVTRPDVST